MSRAIQRLMKDYRKAELLVGSSSNESSSDFASIAAFQSQTYAQQMAQIRRDPELSPDEKKYLVAVEREYKILERIECLPLINNKKYLSIQMLCELTFIS